jgi:5-(carboxyamino)imidazole ribonucleotide synthase
MNPILPGATLGVLGGGQLGRMFAVAARVMGYRVAVLDPDPDSPAGQMADIHLKADYRDAVALLRMASICHAVTTEFENVPAESLEMLAQHCVVAPSAATVAVAQDRIAEKTWFRDHGIATAAFAPVRSADELHAAWEAIGGPALLKLSRLGYDGKGQILIDNASELAGAFDGLGAKPCVLERMVDLAWEVSVVLARNSAGETAVFPVAENRHRSGILDVSIVPARVPPDVAGSARAAAQAIAERMDYCGVLAVEFFVTRAGDILANEMAPRPHNSGHYTLDACVTDQFQQQVRALCDLPLGDPRQLSPVVMVNLLGDVWASGPPWQVLLEQPGLKLHLYGKAEARPGRKMGHYNCLAPELGLAIAIAAQTRAALGITPDLD